MEDFIAKIDLTVILPVLGFVFSEMIGMSKAESNGVLSLIGNIFKRFFN